MQPDESTKKRIKDLAVVGKFIAQISNDYRSESDYFLAKTALEEFKNAILLVELDPETREGINALTLYLQKKVEKRARQSNLYLPDQEAR